MAENELIVPYCTRVWADRFFGEIVFDEVWGDASEEKKLSALKSASDFIDLYVTFYDEDGNPVLYIPDSTDDWSNAVIPRRLKQACAQEAAYLLSLDDNPAEPHPLTVLGLISADGKKFDKDMTPPIFPRGVVKLLRMMNADVDLESTGGEEIQTASVSNTF